jgi:hypothetical protein
VKLPADHRLYSGVHKWHQVAIAPGMGTPRSRATSARKRPSPSPSHGKRNPKLITYPPHQVLTIGNYPAIGSAVSSSRVDTCSGEACLPFGGGTLGHPWGNAPMPLGIARRTVYGTGGLRLRTLLLQRGDDGPHRSTRGIPWLGSDPRR